MHFVGRFLALLIWTSSLILGAIAAILAALRLRRGQVRDEYFGWDVFALIVSVISLLTSLLILRGVLETHNLIVGGIASLQLVFSVAAIAAYRTRWRSLTEGLGAIALGIFSFLTGFSIGFLVLPFAVALGVAAVHHNDPRTRKLLRSP
jgi:hypothetical protein